jgi:hypothetical protein
VQLVEEVPHERALADARCPVDENRCRPATIDRFELVVEHGERIHPLSAELANESAHIAAESSGHDLNAFEAIRRMARRPGGAGSREIRPANRVQLAGTFAAIAAGGAGRW